MTTVNTDQLTLNVLPHPRLAKDLDSGKLRIAGELKIAGALPIAEDLNHGDELLITIATADGRVLVRSYAEVAGPPPLIPIEDKDLGLIGYTRSHKAKPTGDAELIERHR